MYMKKIVMSFLAVLLVCGPMVAQHKSSHPAEGPPPIHNGLWWGSKSSLFRDGFMTGYKSGSMHAIGHPIDLNAFPASELIDGLDSFYKDFRNRNILVDDALVYITDQLRGAPDDKLNAELLKMRAAAAPTNIE
jgi:hypothetical protein